MTQPEDKLYQQLVQAGLETAGPSDDLRRRVLAAATAAQREASQGGDTTISQDPTQPVVRLVLDVPTELADGVSRETYPIEKPPSRRHVRRRFVAMFQRRTIRWSVAAAVAIVVFGGFSLFSGRSRPGAKSDQWWLGPPAAWAAEINAALSRAMIKGVTCRERRLLVNADGSSAMSGTWDKFAVSHDSYRRDIYDGEVLREIQWYFPDQNGHTMHTSVRFDTRSYFTAGPDTGGFGREDPVERMRFYVRLVEKADRLLGTQLVEGRQCVGFEIRPSQYGDNPDTWLDRVWFDVETKLPVRIEQHGRPVTGDPSRTFSTIQDQFDYNPALPADTFTPKIPEGFIHAHPDELLKKQQSR